MPPATTTTSTTTTSSQTGQESAAQTELRGLLKQVRAAKIKHKLRTLLANLLTTALQALSAENAQLSRLSFLQNVGLGASGIALDDPFVPAAAGPGAAAVEPARADAAASAQPCSALAKFVKDVKQAKKAKPSEIPKPTANAWIKKAQNVETAAGCKASTDA